MNINEIHKEHYGERTIHTMLWHIDLVKNNMLGIFLINDLCETCNFIIENYLNGEKTEGEAIDYIWEYDIKDFLYYCFHVNFQSLGRNEKFEKNLSKAYRKAKCFINFSEERNIFENHHTNEYFYKCCDYLRGKRWE